MLRLSQLVFFVTIAASIGLVPLAEAGPTDAEKCEAAKLKESGKYVSCRLSADSKGVKKGVPSDYSKCDTKFSGKWGKIESKYGTLRYVFVNGRGAGAI